MSVQDEAPEGMTRLIAADEVREGDVRKVRLAGVEPIAVCRIDGGYFATQDGCSHAKASLSVANDKGQMPLHLAAQFGVAAAAQALIAAGASVDARDAFGLTAADIALSRGKLDVLETL